MPSTMLLMGCGKSAPGGGGGGAFDAADYGTVLLWGDFTDTTQVKNNSGTQALSDESIATLQDKSSNVAHYTQSTSGNRPTLRTNFVNSLQVGEFDGSNDFLESDGARSLTGNKAGLTFAAVINLDSVAATKTFFEIYDSTGNYRLRIQTLNTSGALFVEGKAQEGGSAFQAYSSGSLGNISASAWHTIVVAADFSGNVLNSWLDGVQCMTDISMSSTGNTTNSTSNVNSYLGQWPQLDGKMGEFILYNGALGSTERGNLIADLETKYGL